MLRILCFYTCLLISCRVGASCISDGSFVSANPSEKKHYSFSVANQLAAVTAGVIGTTAVRVAQGAVGLGSRANVAMILLQHAPVLIATVVDDDSLAGCCASFVGKGLTVLAIGMSCWTAANSPVLYAVGLLATIVLKVASQTFAHKYVHNVCRRLSGSAGEYVEPWLHVTTEVALTSILPCHVQAKDGSHHFSWLGGMLFKESLADTFVDDMRGHLYFENNQSIDSIVHVSNGTALPCQGGAKDGFCSQLTEGEFRLFVLVATSLVCLDDDQVNSSEQSMTSLLCSVCLEQAPSYDQAACYQALATEIPVYHYPYDELPEWLSKKNGSSISLFTYGSLMDTASAGRTLSQQALASSRAACAHGVKVLYNRAVPYEQIPHWGLPLKEKAIAMLNSLATYKQEDMAQGVLIDIPLKDIKVLLAREIGYDLIPVLVRQGNCDSKGKQFKIAYTLSAKTPGEYTDSEVVPRCGYYQVVKKAAQSNGKAFYSFWYQNTYLADGDTTLREYESDEQLSPCMMSDSDSRDDL